MHFILTNEHRKYFGLKPANSSWQMEVYHKNLKTADWRSDYYIYYENNHIKKVVHYDIARGGSIFSMLEFDTDYETDEKHTIIYPKTSRGKIRKITPGIFETLSGVGNYFYIGRSFESSFALIGNYTTQRTYLSEDYPVNNDDDIKVWCDNYVKKATLDDLKEVWNFAQAQRQHVNFKEGDYFRYEIKKNLYMYGRIQLDYYKRFKNKKINYNPYMCHPVIAELFHIITDRKDMMVEELESLKTFPSCPVMDNNFYYGDFVIIGHKELPENIKYPIIYAALKEKIYFQCGNINKEIYYEEGKDWCKGSYCLGGIGLYFYGDFELYKKCIEEKSNASYWQKHYGDADLRSPQNRELLKKVLKDCEEEDLLKIYNNC